MNKKLLAKVIAGAFPVSIALLANHSIATAGVIDTFSTHQGAATDYSDGVGGSSSTGGSAGDTSMLGGFRDIFADAISGAVVGANRTSIAVFNSSSAGDHLNFSNDVGVIGIGGIQWDGDDSAPGHIVGLNPTGLGGIDITEGGTASEFVLEIISSDFGFQFTITAYTDSTHWTAVTLAAISVPSGTGPVMSSIDFAGFTTAALCNEVAGSPLLPEGVLAVVCSDAVGNGGGTQVADLSNLGALDVVLNNASPGVPDIDMRIASITTNGDAPIACRFTGGGVDTFNQWDGTTYETGEMNHNGVGSLPAGVDRYTFGGQAGANTALPPQPKGEWTHHQQTGPSGSFSFHGGTASAAEGTEISKITCSDPGFCNQARPAPAKQLDFEGIGNFHNLGKGNNAPNFRLPNATVATGKGNRGYNGTYHWFEVNIDDLGEPGVADASNIPVCPATGFGVKGAEQLANCDCPDFYRITIYDGVYANADGSITPNKTDVIYEVYGYIDGGNLQIHPLTGFDK